MNYIILSGFITGFILRFIYCKYKSKPYTLESWDEQLNKDFKKYGPVPDFYDAGRLKIAVITPTLELYNKYLIDEVEKDVYFLHHQVSSLKDLENVEFFKVKEGYNSNKVSLDIHRRVQLKLKK